MKPETTRIKYGHDLREEIRYPEDCERIQRILAQAGHIVTTNEAQRIWEAYSDSYCAGWMRLHEKDEDVLSAITEPAR